MQFLEIKEKLYSYFSEKGFSNVTLDKETSWILKNKDINSSYICVSNKEGNIKIEFFNIEVPTNLNFDMNISITENLNGKTKVVNIGNNKELIENNLKSEFLKEQNIKKKNFFITSENMINEDVFRISFISSQRVYGMNIVKDLFSFVRDFIGGRVNNVENALDEAIKDLEIEMKNKALALDADAIIGYKIEHTYCSNNMVSVIATGTAILFKKDKNL